MSQFADTLAMQSTSSTRYDIKNEKESWEIELDLPGVESKDVDVKLEKDGTVLTVSGQRTKSGDGQSYEVDFSHSFGIDPLVDVEQFTADLKNGVLKIRAPKDLTKEAESVQTIPINDGSSNDAMEAGKSAQSTEEVDVKKDA